MTGAPSTAPTPAYAPDPGFYDEAFAGPDHPRPEYEALVEALGGVDLAEVRRAVDAHLRESRVTFGATAGVATFQVDPVPRILSAGEWAALEAGLAQRVRALNAFVADVYGDRRIVAAGRVPARVLDGAEHLEPSLTGVRFAHDSPAVAAGLDLVRGADGEFRVLEDNLRTPSGCAYMTAAREAVDAALPDAVPAGRRASEDVFDLLGAALRAAAPDGDGDPSVVLLSDGPSNSAWYEHQVIAGRLGVPIVSLRELDVRAGRLTAMLPQGPRQVDVVYRRTDVDRFADRRGRPTAVGRALREPITRGKLTCVNGFGTGIADDKLVHAYVEEMVRFYLGEEPRLRSVTTYDLAEPDVLEEALERIDELVVKPRTGHGGHGVVIAGRETREDREELVSEIRRRPERFVAQETVALSSHPTVIRGRLEPRHVDLRPFVFTIAGEPVVVPGGLTRVAFGEGVLVVNSSQDGGGKDTWVLG